MYKAKGKYRIKTPEDPGIEFALFNYTGEMGVDNFGCLSSSLSLFLFCNESAKKKQHKRFLIFNFPLRLKNNIFFCLIKIAMRKRSFQDKYLANWANYNLNLEMRSY